VTERKTKGGDFAGRKPATGRAADRGANLADEHADAVAEPTLELASLIERDAAQDPPVRARSARPHWRALLSGSSPREVLARLMSGDPLSLRPCIAAVLAERLVLIEPDRVFLRAVARIARFAVRYRGQPEIDVWIRQQIEETVLELLDDDAEADEGVGVFEDSGIGDLARPLGIESSRARAACDAFNRLTLEERSAFHALVLVGRSLDEVAAQTRRGATEIARAARRALDAVLAAADERDDQP